MCPRALKTQTLWGIIILMTNCVHRITNVWPMCGCYLIPISLICQQYSEKTKMLSGHMIFPLNRCVFEHWEQCGAYVSLIIAISVVEKSNKPEGHHYFIEIIQYYFRFRIWSIVISTGHFWFLIFTDLYGFITDILITLWSVIMIYTDL